MPPVPFVVEFTPSGSAIVLKIVLRSNFVGSGSKTRSRLTHVATVIAEEGTSSAGTPAIFMVAKGEACGSQELNSAPPLSLPATAISCAGLVIVPLMLVARKVVGKVVDSHGVVVAEIQEQAVGEVGRRGRRGHRPQEHQADRDQQSSSHQWYPPRSGKEKPRSGEPRYH